MRILDRPWMVLILSSLAPVAFFYSNNGGTYSILSIVVGLLVAVFIGLTLYGLSACICYLLVRLIAGEAPAAERRRNLIRSAVYGIAACFIILFLSHLTWRVGIPRGSIRAAFVLGFFALIFLVMYKTRFSTISIFLIVSVLLSVGTIESIAKRLAEFDMTPSMIARDRTAVFLALRWPDSMEEVTYPEKGLSHVNLLPYVFSALNSVPFHLKDYGKNDAYHWDTLILEDGVPLETWRKVINRK